MTIGIYFIRHKESGKTYVGKSINIERRLIAHKCDLTSKTRISKDCNRHLKNSVTKYGWENFETGILEEISNADETVLRDRELYWIDKLNTCDRRFGFNLRRDSSTNTIVHPETLALMKDRYAGENNPNYGRKWSEEQKKRMSEIAKARHASGKYYTDEWRKSKSETSKMMWENDRDKMLKAVELARKKMIKYRYFQYSKCGNLIKVWNSVRDIVKENPEYKTHNIYAACSGEKPSIYGYIWKKVPL